METSSQKQDVLMRLRRIEGQVRGLQRMVEEGIPCEQILTQVSAVSSAVKKAGLVMVRGYMDECLEKAGRLKGISQRDRLREFHKAVSRYIDAA